jgi:sec-independent protein translocase protein TatA
MTGWIMPGRPGMGEVVILILLILLFFGAKRLPDLARSLGKSLNEFKKGRQESESELSETEGPEKKAE